MSCVLHVIKTGIILTEFQSGAFNHTLLEICARNFRPYILCFTCNKTGMIFHVFICQDMESYLSEHTSENRATIEELKQEMIVNSILSDMVKTESDEYVQRLETLEKQVLTET